jgi:hypothetical protein
MPSRIFVRDKLSGTIWIDRNITKKWPKNANGPKDDEYELLVLQYDANKDALVAEKKKET